MPRILMHEYVGYAFPVELSRELARRGHEVLHAYSASVQAPKGDLTSKVDDPKTLYFHGIDIGSPIEKYSFVKRRFQEIRHGRPIDHDGLLDTSGSPDWHDSLRRRSWRDRTKTRRRGKRTNRQINVTGAT